MKVKMLVHTGWEGKPLHPGTLLDVPTIVAERWQKNRIAQIVEKETDKPIVSAAIISKPLAEMNIVELKTFAKESGYRGYTNLGKTDLLEFIRDKISEE